MHFPIIALEEIDTKKEDWTIDLGYEDSCLNANADYYGELYSPEDRRKVIKSDWLKELLEGIATIDTEKETITFLDSKTIQNTLYDYYLKKSEELYEAAGRQGISGFDFREAGRHFRDFYTLFYDDCGKTSLDFVEDAYYHAGETKQIGNIFDTHF